MLMWLSSSTSLLNFLDLESVPSKLVNKLSCTKRVSKEGYVLNWWGNCVIRLLEACTIFKFGAFKGSSLSNVVKLLALTKSHISSDISKRVWFMPLIILRPKWSLWTMKGMLFLSIRAIWFPGKTRTCKCWRSYKRKKFGFCINII